VRLLLVLAALLAGLTVGADARAAAVEAGTRPWPSAAIEVWVAPDVKRTPRYRHLTRAMAEWNRVSGVAFRETARPGRDTLYVFAHTGSRCDALTGYRAGFTHEGRRLRGGRITLGACSYGSVLHELGHVLGLMHEHQRADRDRYLDLSAVNRVLAGCAPGACEEARLNVGRPRPVILLSDYDPCSLMHYLADQSAKARSGRFPASPVWVRWYRLTPAGEAAYGLCRARLKPVDGCGWSKTGQKCQVTCQDANVVAVFHGLKPRQACWGGPVRRRLPFGLRTGSLP